MQVGGCREKASHVGYTNCVKAPRAKCGCRGRAAGYAKKGELADKCYIRELNQYQIRIKFS